MSSAADVRLTAVASGSDGGGIGRRVDNDGTGSMSSASNPTLTSGDCKYPSYVLRDYDFNDPSIVICLMLVFFGLVYCFLGYRCFRGTMFLTGFVFGSVIVYSFCIDDALCPPYAKIGLSLGIGVVIGLLTMLVCYVGLFLIGFHTGIIACFAAVTSISYFGIRMTNIWLSIASLLTFGILFALATLHWKKGLTIIGTSMYGAAVLVGTLDYFVEKALMMKWAWEKLILKNTVQPCEISHFILLAWPIIVVLGLLVQYGLTGKGNHHIKGFEKQSRHNSIDNLRRRGRSRGRDLSSDSSQKKYRYLYQVRTAHGDVISQNYVQALQRKVMPNMITTMGESSTLQSDATHLTTLPVDQTMTQLSDSKTNTVDSEGSVRFDNSRYQNLSSRESVQSNVSIQYYQ